MTLPAWLNDHFRSWERDKGRRQTVSSFARWLGVKQPTLVRWMNGDSDPEGENLRLLARKLGPEIYAIVGQTPPDDLFMDEHLEPLAELLLSLPEKKRKAFRESLVAYAIDLARQVIDDP